jgi:hypothetical protein
VVDQYTSKMRQRPTIVITEKNLQSVQVVLSPKVNTKDAPLPKRCAFHVVVPHYFDPALSNSKDWRALLSKSSDDNPDVV